MNIVYWLEFSQRIKNKTPPYFYIGSKHDCAFEDGVILDLKYSSRKEYWSSSEQPDFLEALAIEKPIVKILSVCDNILDEEEWYHKHYDIPKSPLFFNKASAHGNYGGAGERAPRYGMKNSKSTCEAISKAQSGVPKSDTHKQSISEGLHAFYENDVKNINNRGRSVVKTLSESAKKRYRNPDNTHPKGMLGKSMPRFICEFCGYESSINFKSRHLKKCNLNALT